MLWLLTNLSGPLVPVKPPQQTGSGDARLHSQPDFGKIRHKGSRRSQYLYGGSCNPGNAKALFANKDVDGGLIGGASLKADDFLKIAASFE